jgi:hypothetical protein
MSDRAGYAGAQVEVDDLHKVRAIFRTSDYSGAQAELEAALRDVDESVFAGRLLRARSRVRCASRGLARIIHMHASFGYFVHYSPGGVASG